MLPSEGCARLNQAVSLSDLCSAVTKSRLDVWDRQAVLKNRQGQYGRPESEMFCSVFESVVRLAVINLSKNA